MLRPVLGLQARAALFTLSWRAYSGGVCLESHAAFASADPLRAAPWTEA